MTVDCGVIENRVVRLGQIGEDRMRCQLVEAKKVVYYCSNERTWNR